MHSATFEIQAEVHMMIHATIEFKNLGATYSDIIQHERAEILFGVLHRKVLNVQKRIHEATQKDCGYEDRYVNTLALDNAVQVLTEYSVRSGSTVSPGSSGTAVRPRPSGIWNRRSFSW